MKISLERVLGPGLFFVLRVFMALLSSFIVRGSLSLVFFRDYFSCSYHLLYVGCPIFEFCTSFSGLLQVFKVVLWCSSCVLCCPWFFGLIVWLGCIVGLGVLWCVFLVSRIFLSLFVISLRYHLLFPQFFLFCCFPVPLLGFFGHFSTVLVFLLHLSSVCMLLQSPFFVVFLTVFSFLINGPFSFLVVPGIIVSFP